MWYVYYSYEEFGRGYIGYRKCKEGYTPETDPYFGSASDTTFKPTNKIILEVYDNGKDAIDAEIALHEFYKVDINPHFANRARQRTNRFYQTNISKGHKQKISKALKGITPWNKNKEHSQKTKNKISKSISGSNHPMYGRTHKTSSIKKMSEAKQGKKHPLYGKPRSEETRRKISETRKRNMAISSQAKNKNNEDQSS